MRRNPRRGSARFLWTSALSALSGDADFVREGRAQPFLKQIVEHRQECGERFARAGWRSDERVASRPDGRPALLLGGGGFSERFGEPSRHDRMEQGKRHDSRDHRVVSGRGDQNTREPVRYCRPLVRCCADGGVMPFCRSIVAAWL